MSTNGVLYKRLAEKVSNNFLLAYDLGVLHCFDACRFKGQHSKLLMDELNNLSDIEKMPDIDKMEEDGQEEEQYTTSDISCIIQFFHKHLSS